MSFAPSTQQATYYDWIENGSGSAILEAVAGAGKTTTLVHGLSLMRGSVFFGAFNKAIASEIKARVQPTGAAQVDVSTFHAAGLRFWRRVAREVQVDGDKVRNILRTAVERNPAYAPYVGVVRTLVSLGKQAGIGCLQPTSREAWLALVEHHCLDCPTTETGEDDEVGLELVLKLANRTLKASVELDHEVIDFDDMIYSPLLHNARIFQHDWVLVDEAQDTNATRRELALRMLKPNGRLVAVGDPRQAIYGFTGADSDAMDLLADATNAVRLPLTVTYRCPKAVVQVARQWVSHIEAADTAPEGEVLHADATKLTTLATPGDAVLCRFNAPLLQGVYAFIAAGIPARVEGREIGDGLIKLARRWRVIELVDLEERLASYQDNETAKLMAQGKDAQVTALEDRINCLRVVIDRVREQVPSATVTDVVSSIAAIFGDGTGPAVTFSSIHKSKGREWNRVVWLQVRGGRKQMQPWQQVQEQNLCYVAATRAKKTLVLAS